MRMTCNDFYYYLVYFQRTSPLAEQDILGRTEPQMEGDNEVGTSFV
jgi:hypothetical protein